MINKYLLKAIVLVLFVLTASYTGAQSSEALFQPNEELVYEVTFLGIKLGSIRIISEREEDMVSSKVLKAKCLVDSYGNIPFVSLHAVFETWMDPSMGFSHKFVGNSQFITSDWDYEKIIFDYTRKLITDDKWRNKARLSSDTFYTQKRWSDGLSLFFLARRYLNSKRSIIVPTIMSRDTSPTYLNFLGKSEKIEIDAVKYPIRALYFSGRAEWKGIYGLSGKFDGWFTDDEARVPIKAKMNVYIGSVNIELLRWNAPAGRRPRLSEPFAGKAIQLS